MKTKILEKEGDDWFRFCSDHPSMRVAQTCLENISPWSNADRYPDFVSRLHVQIRLMGNFTQMSHFISSLDRQQKNYIAIRRFSSPL